MAEKYFFNTEDGLSLCGILSHSEEESDKCIVLCHGLTVNKDEADGVFKKFSRKLQAAGFHSFRFDFRGNGESEGSSVNLTVTGEVKDLEAAIKFLRARGYKKFGILAASFGAGPASFFVSENQHIINALVLWNPLIDYRRLLHPELPWPKKYFGEDAMRQLRKKGFIEVGSSHYRVGEPLIKELRSLNPREALLRIKIPVLFVHGDRDTCVPYEDSVKYSRLLKSAALKTMRGSEHGLHKTKKESDEVDTTTVKFFLKYI